jgi:hypothetical protein
MDIKVLLAFAFTFEGGVNDARSAANIAAGILVVNAVCIIGFFYCSVTLVGNPKG